MGFTLLLFRLGKRSNACNELNIKPVEPSAKRLRLDDEKILELLSLEDITSGMVHR
jgi:hypothetical protein